MSLRISKEVSIPVDTTDLLPEDDGINAADRDKGGRISSLLRFFTTHPSDWNLVLNEAIETIDWDSKSTTLAQPLGNFFTFAFYLIRLLQLTLVRPRLHRFNDAVGNFDLSKSEVLKKYEYVYDFTRGPYQSAGNAYYRYLSMLSKFLDMSILFFVFTNGFITYKFFWGNFKIYCLFYLKKRPHMKNVTESSLRTLGKDDSNDGYLWSSLLYFWNDRDKEVNDANDNGNDEGIDTYYRLSKWTPSQFMTMLFVSFAPTTVVFLLFTEVSFLTLMAVLCHQWILYHLVIDRYDNRLEHESVIASANLAELDAKFIKPRMSKRVQDVSVDCTPHGDGIVRFYPALTVKKSRTFQTHSLTGELITEVFNPMTKEFEDMETQGTTHNLVRTAPQMAKFHPSRMSRPPGLYSSLGSISGMSTPLIRADSSPYLNVGHTLGERQIAFLEQHSKVFNVLEGSSDPESARRKDP